jgi:hypothetical protein
VLDAACTPWLQINGNKKLKVGLQVKNKVLLRDAIDFYTQGLGEKCSDNALNAVLHCNRAHVQSLLGEWLGVQGWGDVVCFHVWK